MWKKGCFLDDLSIKIKCHIPVCMLKYVHGEISTNKTKIKQELKEYTEDLYSKDIKILILKPATQKSLVVKDEVRLALRLLLKRRATCNPHCIIITKIN